MMGATPTLGSPTAMSPAPSTTEAAMEPPSLPHPGIVARPIDPLLHPLRAFFRHRLAGAGLLLLGAVVALAWASSPWSGLYQALLHLELGVHVGDLALDKSLHHWVNDGLMALFFFVIGLELKREVIEGELSTLRKAALPAVCAVAGMAVPALCYLLINRGTGDMTGWGIPMATDIAFALGVLALLGDRVKPALKIFVTAVAVADDLGAIIVIAVFYTQELSFIALGASGVLLAVAIAMNVVGVRDHMAWALIGVAIWLCFLRSGVHATLAAVLVAFAIPARTRLDSQGMAATLGHLLQRYRSLPLPSGHGLLPPEEQRVLYEIEDVVEEGTAPLQRLEHGLLPLVTFVVLPVFALMNAGVTLGGAGLTSPKVFAGVFFGLVIGKPLGITLAAWVATRARIAELPSGVTLADVGVVGVLAGIGFTMSLFIGELAFSSPSAINDAKLGTLCASSVAAALGLLLVWWQSRSRALGSAT